MAAVREAIEEAQKSTAASVDSGKRADVALEASNGHTAKLAKATEELAKAKAPQVVLQIGDKVPVSINSPESQSSSSPPEESLQRSLPFVSEQQQP
jgi:hypothetical protein